MYKNLAATVRACLLAVRESLFADPPKPKSGIWQAA
jgi:hypothetical protein